MNYLSKLTKTKSNFATIPKDTPEYTENPFFEFEIEKLKTELAGYPPSNTTPLHIILKVVELNILHHVIKNNNRERYISRLESYKDIKMLYPEVFIPIMAKHEGGYYKLFEFNNSLLNKWLETGIINKIEVFRQAEYMTINFKEIPEFN